MAQSARGIRRVGYGLEVGCNGRGGAYRAASCTACYYLNVVVSQNLSQSLYLTHSPLNRIIPRLRWDNTDVCVCV